MSLNGDLKHFPIIDIIQLLHGSRKSGILRLTCVKGECQLVFHNGDLVGANYLNSRVRIGQVLVSSGAITKEQLAQALEIQNSAGDERKPLVITLLEHDMVDETAAYNGLESLIEMTIIEVLTWQEGNFSLEIAPGTAGGGYLYSRSGFPQRILLSAQGVLMDSLRIFDEKMRDGTMDEILSIAGVSNKDLEPEPPGCNAPAMTGDGCDRYDAQTVLQELLAEKRNLIQRSSDQSYRGVDEVKKLIVAEFPTAAKALKRRLLMLLAGPGPEGEVAVAPPDSAVIVITRSPLMSTMVRSICFQEGIHAASAENILAVDIHIRLLLCQRLHLVILLDAPHDGSIQETIQLCEELQKYPQSTVVLAGCARFWDTLGLQALGSGIRFIIPRPCRECADGTYMEQALAFCSGLGGFLRTLSSEYRNSDAQRFLACIARLRGCTSRTEISVAILEYLVELFERAIVFLVTESSLVAEYSFGVTGDKGEGMSPLANLQIPLDDQEIIQEVIKTGRMYYGFHNDSTWPHQLYRVISRPDSPEVLLFPFIRANTVVAFIYADFGSKPVSPPSLYYLDALLHYTTAQISVSAYRQKLKSLQDAAGQKWPVAKSGAA